MPTRKPIPKRGPTTALYIKNMVCDRCIRVVREELAKLKLDVRSVALGEVVLTGRTSELPMEKVRSVLLNAGFELIEDRKAKVIERIKLAILELVRGGEDEEKRLKYSEYLSKKLGLDYHYLSMLFSSVEVVTIEQYIILQKIERVKELLKYGELTLTEIAYTLGYSSVQHLSNQFKHVTGLTPSEFKVMTAPERRPLDHVVDS
jgi:AraC family transcriptional regulator